LFRTVILRYMWHDVKMNFWRDGNGVDTGVRESTRKTQMLSNRGKNWAVRALLLITIPERRKWRRYRG